MPPQIWARATSREKWGGRSGGEWRLPGRRGGRGGQLAALGLTRTGPGGADLWAEWGGGQLLRAPGLQELFTGVLKRC